MDSICLFKSKLFSNTSNINYYLFQKHFQTTQFTDSYSNSNADTSIPAGLIISEQSITEHAWLLLPAIFGTGAAYLSSLIQELGQSQEFPKMNSGYAVKSITFIYVFASVIGIAVFIYRSIMGVKTQNPLQRLLPVGIGLVSATFLFASVNLALSVIFPKSFANYRQDSWVDRAIDFLYYSALGLTTGVVGDITPTESITRLLLAMEGMVNLVIFSLLIASLFS